MSFLFKITHPKVALPTNFPASFNITSYQLLPTPVSFGLSMQCELLIPRDRNLPLLQQSSICYVFEAALVGAFPATTNAKAMAENGRQNRRRETMIGRGDELSSVV